MSEHSWEPDVSFTARVVGRRLRWHDGPRTSVSFHGSPGYRSVSESDRLGLPDRVRAGHTYRDITVDYRFACALPDSEAAENPGEDDDQPRSQSSR